MKRQLTLFILFIGILTNSIAQIVDIPDANFKNALVNLPVVDLGGGIFMDADTNNDGEIQVSEAEAVIGMEVVELEIASLIGIEYFINLIYLDCSDNLLNSLDINQNVNLESLDCRYNFLSELDVSQNLALRALDCGFNELSVLDISENVDLIGLVCMNNQIENLDVTNNPLLFTIWCQSNLITALDLSNNQELITLYCHNNQLSELDISPIPGLSGLTCGINNLTSLDLSQNPSLFYLHCGLNQIEELDLSNNPNLGIFSCRNMESLTYLDLRNGNNMEITTLWVDETPNLNCILIDDSTYANNQDCSYPVSGWCKDVNDLFIETMEDCILGVSESIVNSISIYPNPVEEVLTIVNPTGLKITSIALYDAMGRKVLESNQVSEQITVSHLSAGVYFLQVVTYRGEVMKRVVKK